VGREIPNEACGKCKQEASVTLSKPGMLIQWAVLMNICPVKATLTEFEICRKWNGELG